MMLVKISNSICFAVRRASRVLLRVSSRNRGLPGLLHSNR